MLFEWLDTAPIFSVLGKKKWPLLYNRPINMNTIRDSLSSLHLSFSSLRPVIQYAFQVIIQIKFCLFDTITYSAPHLFSASGDPANIPLPTPSIVCIIWSNSVKRKAFQRYNATTFNMSLFERLSASRKRRQKKTRFRSKLIHPSCSIKWEIEIFFLVINNSQKQTTCCQ